MSKELAPGRELDALIAEKVMGLRERERCTVCSGTGYIDQDRCHVCHYTKISPGFIRNLIPNYSTDIAAAWEVVEKLNLLSDERQTMLQRYHDGNWHVAIGYTGAGWEFTGESIVGETAPHAICLTALKAVESKG